MFFYLNLLFIVIAVSLDGFGVGVTYGMRKIRISFLALGIIMLCSGLIVLTSMFIGQMIRMFISPSITSMLGSIILFALGLFVLISILRSNLNQDKNNQIKISEDENSNNESPLDMRRTSYQFNHFKSVISDPQKADKDKSGSISVGEAIVLGTVLALDAFGAGLGAAMLGYPPILTSILIATMSGLFVFTGITTGFLLSKSKSLAKLTYMPPILLICIGIYNLL